MNYSPLTEEHFRHPRNLGPLPGAAGQILRGEAGSAAEGLWIAFEARLHKATLETLSFRALACPHLIAACSRATELLTGTPLEAARRFSALALAAELGVPDEKRGRLLVLEDALRRCLAAWDTTQSPGGYPHPQ
jgi:NifU-like protein involved in Fe-S cluster formation